MIDFPSVQWARRLQPTLAPFLEKPETDLRKLSQLFNALASLKAADVTPTEAQLTVLLQYLHTKDLNSLEAVKGGLMVQFCGGGYEYECFLLRDDGRMPNHKYQAKKLTSE